MGKKAKTKITKQPDGHNKPDDNSIEKALHFLLKRRAGGSINFKGIGFQVLYASSTLLKILDQRETNSITLEGLEDIDVRIGSDKHYIQLKTSQNEIDAGTLWNLKVLQHFWEVFFLNPAAKFRLVHNTNISKGNIEGIGASSIPDHTMGFWKTKFNSIGITPNEEIFRVFLQSISIERTKEEALIEEIKKQLFEKFQINIGTELQYIKALFYNVFEWSQQRQEISYKHVAQLLQSVKDSFSKFPINSAIQNNWITPVSYEIKNEKSGYYDGKAARPEDIAKRLPVERPIWENEIIKGLREFDVVVIKSSSGQGKSTLAWQAGFALTHTFAIYQLNICSSYDNAASVADFLRTRVVIGQTPIVVIDGLNKNISAWAELAEMISDQPIKLLITTREEDWIRFGGDDSRISLHIINIGLAVQEAAQIYQHLKHNNRLHESITTWQPAWEKVKDKALLIEYIFVITQGQMIEERLNYQVNQLAKEEASSTKLEILRLVSLADVLSIRVKTENLTEHIKKNIGQLDRNAIYRQLEKEYYLKFEKKYIEGLHPVRSEHLVKILHSHIDVQQSLLALLDIIDEDYIYDYFISVPLYYSIDDEFYRKAARIIAKRSLAEVVFAIDGLMHYEPYRYWLENKNLFDELRQNGGFSMFVYDAIPFNNLNTLEKLNENLTDDLGSNIRYLIKQKARLTKYSISESVLFGFVKYLGNELVHTRLENAEGIAFLFKWFKRVGVNFPNLIEIDEDGLLGQLSHNSIGESSELFHYYSLVSPEKYREFLNEHRETIIGWIKVKTNCLSIYEKEDNIYIEYILDSDADKANEQSVYRINIVHAFLPFYKRYCTSAVVLPFPNEEIYKVVLGNAHKEIPPENLSDDFDVHINQIWAKTIFGQYSASSSYEWQKEQLHIRGKCVEFLKAATRLLESRLEKDVRKSKLQAKQADALASEFITLEQSLKKFPSSNRKYFDKVPFESEQKAISEWLSSIRNFVMQLGGMINPSTDQDRRLPWVNLKSATYRLEKMQDAFEKMTNGAHKYFSTDQLINDERSWYKRALETVQYYLDQAKSNFKDTVIVASKSVAIWNEIETARRLSDLYEIFRRFQGESRFIFYLPSKITEEENLCFAVIGIGGCNLRNEQDLWDLSVGLMNLATIEVHFFTFIFVDDQKNVTGALRFNRHYFEIFKNYFDTGVYDEGESSPPLPIFPDEAMLSVLDGITLQTVPSNFEFEMYFKMLVAVWKLSEYRRNLDANVSIEKQWLDRLEKEYGHEITQSLSIVYDTWTLKVKPDRVALERFLDRQLDFERDELVNYLLEVSLILNETDTA